MLKKTTQASAKNVENTIYWTPHWRSVLIVGVSWISRTPNKKRNNDYKSVCTPVYMASKVIRIKEAGKWKNIPWDGTFTEERRIKSRCECKRCVQ